MNESDAISKSLKTVREQNPLVHNITNYVVMNFTANALLAIGASPVMAHAKEEIQAMTAISKALVINIGTLSSAWIESMILSIKEATLRNIPIVLDPVGAGATPYRREMALTLLESGRISVVRGNASEIMALNSSVLSAKGVDTILGSEMALQSARTLAEKYDCTVCVSGAIDLIIDRKRLLSVHNGHKMMTKVTGLGCVASALIGAFLGVDKDAFDASVIAMAINGISGEIAATKADGPGSFQSLFLDSLYNLAESEIQSHAKVSAHAF